MPHSFPTRRSSDLDASHCGAELDLPALPVDPALDGLDAGLRQQAALAGGDVYQLCFTVPPARREEIARLAARTSTRATPIEIGRAHVCTPVTNAHLVSRLLLEKNKCTSHMP